MGCSIMKLCVVLLASLCVGCFAVDIGMLITNEVREIVHANPGMTLVDCATKCDAEFDLIAGKDEAVVDNYCHAICDCVINHHCPNSHATRPPHTQPTRPQVAVGAAIATLVLLVWVLYVKKNK